jgi:hypothetical protein
MKYKFNKQATTNYFGIKVKVANYIIKSFTPIGETRKSPGGYEIYGTFKDEQRNVFIDLYLGRKIKGVGAGLPIECKLNYSLEHHPELNFKALSKKDVMVYYNEATQPIETT